MPDLPQTVLDAVIDVSHYQGDGENAPLIDWQAVAGAGIVLSFIKASEGAGYSDPVFARNRDTAQEAGILVVPYHFITGLPGDAQARHFLQTLGSWKGPTMLDWETNASVADVAQMGKIVADAMGRAPVGYYGYSKLADPDPDLSAWPLMLPEYPEGYTPGNYASLVQRAPRVPPGRNPARPYDFHQYTPAGKVAGITTSVDRSIWVGTKDDLIAWHKTGALPATF